MDRGVRAKSEIKLKPEVEVVEPTEIMEPGELGAVLELIVKDKDGKVVERRVQKSRSFVRQFLELLFMQFQAMPYNDNIVIRNTSNVLVDVAATNLTFACEANAADDSYGIVVGTGTNTPTINDYALQTQIAHGVGTTQMQYGDVAFGLPTNDASMSQMTVTRDFAANANITVYEIGLYVIGRYFKQDARAGDHWDGVFCVIRDVIPAGILVASGQTLTVNYREQASV